MGATVTVSHSDIATEVISRGVVAEISGTTVWRCLSDDAIKPWRHRSWIFSRDPDFEAKASWALDLDARKCKALGENDYVLSADEKTSIQARARRHPSLFVAPRRDARVEHECGRKGPAVLCCLGGAPGKDPEAPLLPLPNGSY